MSDHEPGRLVIVATPIGNLDDLSPRAREALEEADVIACEDTRRAGLLLQRLGFKRPLLSLHDHNEERRTPQILQRLGTGTTVAMVSDAGTPLVCDPGYRIVRAALEAGYEIDSIPGSSALLDALVLSGMPPYPFTFGGFPPVKPGKRRRFFESFAACSHTLIFYVSPHRLESTLETALETLGDRPGALARELTKLHQEVLRKPLSELLQTARERQSWRGELVLVLGPRDTKPSGGE